MLLSLSRDGLQVDITPYSRKLLLEFFGRWQDVDNCPCEHLGTRELSDNDSVALQFGPLIQVRFERFLLARLQSEFLVYLD